MTQGSSDSILLALHEVERDRVGVVRLQHPLLLALKLLTFDVQLLAKPLSVLPLHLEFLANRGFELGAELGGQRRQQSVVDLLDLLLDLAHRYGPHLAVDDLVVPPSTDKVWIDDSGSGVRHLHEHPRAATSAVERRLQEVLVPFGPFAESAGGQDDLDHLPGLVIDECLVTAGVLHSLEGDDALVVRIGQDLLEPALAQRLAWNLGSGKGSDPAGSELAGEIREAHLPCGVLAERPGQVLGTLRVSRHGAKFTALLIHRLQIAVAKWSASRRASGPGLHGHAFENLDGEVARVELVHRGKDAVQQHPGWSLIDRLGRGNQTNFATLECSGDVSVIATVAGEAIEFVDDDEVDFVLVQVLEHRVQVASLTRAGSGLAAILELLDDDRAHRGCLVPVGLTLGWDREAFDVATTTSRLTGS